MRLPHRISIHLVVGIVALQGAGVMLAAPSGPVRLSRAAGEAVTHEIEKSRVDAQAWLKSDPASYLATIDRKDFDDRRMLKVGRSAGNDVRIDDPTIAAHHLRVTIEGDRFRVQAVDGSAQFKVSGEGGVLKDVPSRSATVDPSTVQIGRFLLRLSHQGFPGIIVFDPQSPHFHRYKGLKYFPPDLAYRFELPLTPNPAPDTVTILSTRGNQRRATRIGWFDLLIGNQPARLEALRLLEPGVGENDVSIFFRDATSGVESYELGRYIDAKKLTDGRFLVDFNLAYNPACAYSVHYNCPIPPKTNVLPMAIRAGEMDAHYEVKFP